MLTKSKFSKRHNIKAWNSLWLFTLKLNSGIFPSKYRINSPTISMVIVYVQCKDEGEQRRKYQENRHLTPMIDFNIYILFFICCNTLVSPWENLFSGPTVFTLNIWTLDLTCRKFWPSPFYYRLKLLENGYMSGKQCRPWSDAAFCGVLSGSTVFAQVCLSQILWLL